MGDVTTLTPTDLAALMLVAAGNVWRQGARDVRRGPVAAITVDTRRLFRAGLVYVKPDRRLGLTAAGRKIRDGQHAEVSGVTSTRVPDTCTGDGTG